MKMHKLLLTALCSAFLLTGCGSSEKKQESIPVTSEVQAMRENVMDIPGTKGCKVIDIDTKRRLGKYKK